ncbi:MAG: acetylornithine transaminase [Firmicutes bacterium]|jgi:predicted acetylornithine/succinylornithine family transaminase|nr:acetylornithine transaminase [Bacillota bacterium]MDH7495123.1 acetylornithine transaminase [Bacillota bacterium]
MIALSHSDTTERIAELSRTYLMNTYSRAPVAPIRGSGVRLWDASGKEYLDFLGGIAVNGLGHAHPAVVAAVQKQAAMMIHCSNLYLIEGQALLAKALLDGTPFGKAFFCNSGAEANEAAIKLARKYARAVREEEGRYEIVTALNSFHGRTLATVTATGQAKYQKGFEPLPPGFRYVPFNDASSLEEAVGDQTAAVLLEAIQGEGGVKVADEAYLKRAREICDERGALLILDEVQTGMGRTGKMFAFEHSGIEPDAVTLAKSLGGGVPIGALLAKDEVAAAFTPGTHASTFGGNPLACAAALAVVETIKSEGLAERAADVGAYFAESLRDLGMRFPQVAEVRGKGLMIALELRSLHLAADQAAGGTGGALGAPARAVAAACLDGGLLVNAVNDNTLRFLPPLVVTRGDIDEAVAILERAMRDVLG